MWELHITDRAKVVPGMVELAEKLEPEHGIRIRKMSRRQPAQASSTCSARPTTRPGRTTGASRPTPRRTSTPTRQDLQLVFDTHWFMVAEKIDTGESVGVAITVPDINQVLKKMNGPACSRSAGGTSCAARKIMDRVRVGFLGVKPEYQHTGVAAGLYIEHFDMAGRTPQKWGEMGWILETNDAMNRGMEGMGGRVVKRYRVYERALRT